MIHDLSRDILHTTAGVSAGKESIRMSSVFDMEASAE